MLTLKMAKNYYYYCNAQLNVGAVASVIFVTVFLQILHASKKSDFRDAV